MKDKEIASEVIEFIAFLKKNGMKGFNLKVLKDKYLQS